MHIIQNKKIIVTGGAGFIGSNLVEMLCESNEVIVFDNLVTGKRNNIKSGDISFVQDSIVNYEAVKKVIKNADYVFHLAALVSVPESVKHPQKIYEVNVKGTLNVLVASKEAGIEKLIFTSSSAIYGVDPPTPIFETFAPDPQSPYAVSKLAGEQYCRVFSDIYNLPTISLRLFNVYGPHQDPKSEYAAVIPKFVSQLNQNKPPTIFGDGEQTRDFIFVKDVAWAFVLAAQSQKSDGETINIASGNGISINELADTIAQLMGKKIEVTHTKERPGDVRHSVADIGKAGDMMGFKPKHSLVEGLKDTISCSRKSNSK